MEGAGLPGLLVGLKWGEIKSQHKALLHDLEKTTHHTCGLASVRQDDLGCTHSDQHQLQKRNNNIDEGYLRENIEISH